jgi:hypothetical protein
MFAVFLRAAPAALFAALLGAILKTVTGPLFAFMGPRSEGHMLRTGLEAATQNWLTVGVLAVAVGILYGAVVESRVAG